tara:strand:- start:1981 stop:2307 length:327 start_codon:yes stop_codon:yes gene_type:complete
MPLISCALCEKEYCFISSLCVKCRRAKHLLSIYGDDFYTCLEEVLVRSKKQQGFKVSKIEKKGLDTDNSNDRDYEKDCNESVILYSNTKKEIKEDLLEELKEKIKEKV